MPLTPWKRKLVVINLLTVVNNWRGQASAYSYHYTSLLSIIGSQIDSSVRLTEEILN